MAHFFLMRKLMMGQVLPNQRFCTKSPDSAKPNFCRTFKQIRQSCRICVKAVSQAATMRKILAQHLAQRLVRCLAIIGDEIVPQDGSLYIFVDRKDWTKHAAFQAIALMLWLDSNLVEPSRRAVATMWLQFQSRSDTNRTLILDTIRCMWNRLNTGFTDWQVNDILSWENSFSAY